MGLFHSRPSPCPVDEADVIVTMEDGGGGNEAMRLRPNRNKTTFTTTMDLPTDVYTLILEFLMGNTDNTTTEQQQQQLSQVTKAKTETTTTTTTTNMDVTMSSIVSFRLVSKSTKRAFDNMGGWTMVYEHLEQRCHVLTNMINVLQATIVHPQLTSSLSCIIRIDAYLSQCWTLKNGLAVKRRHLQDVVLPHIRTLVEEQSRTTRSSSVDTSSCSTASTTMTTTNRTVINKSRRRSTSPSQQQESKLILISEWQYDECILRFEPVANQDLHGFALPAIDQSELPFVLA